MILAVAKHEYIRIYPDNNTDKMQQRTCQQCGQGLKGRIDKKFCSDQCRFLFNNRKKRQAEITMANVNQTLRKNRTILKGFNPVGKTTIRKQLLISQQFNFDFYTHIYRTRTGMVYYFCYEYGYSFTADEKVVLVTWQPYMNHPVNEVMFKKRFDPE